MRFFLSSCVLSAVLKRGDAQALRGNEQLERKTQLTNWWDITCWGITSWWSPQKATGWFITGWDFPTQYCTYQTDRDVTAYPATAYATELECCQGLGNDYCFTMMNPAPTRSPSAAGSGPFYPNKIGDFNDQFCVAGTPSIPGSAPVYDTEYECCSQYYATQTSGTCLSSMVNAPTRSPSSTAGLWCVAKVSLPWVDGYCECQTTPTAAGITYYESEFECCSKHYSGQNPAVCLSKVANAPTKSPSSDPEPQFYPIWGSDYKSGKCDNNPNARPSTTNLYFTQKECCDAWFPDQEGKTCLRTAPSVGTLSPTVAPKVIYYPEWGNTYKDGRCILSNENDAPNSSHKYPTLEACCNAWFAKQDNSYGYSPCLLGGGYTNPPSKQPTPKPTSSPTKKPTATPTKVPTLRANGAYCYADRECQSFCCEFVLVSGLFECVPQCVRNWRD